MPPRARQPGEISTKKGVAWSLFLVRLLRRPDHSARRRGADAVEGAAGGDEQRLAVLAAEGAVGDLVAEDRQEGEQLPLRTQYVDAALDVPGRLGGRVGLV